ncbi:hypothetical protein NQ314_016475 [Rhamnusium bicolor]|uniref:Uncharacterized protein n=1 Tax=Rhamnusium bicolor TaxID=1586634 RepID=A0AAV8WX81_9CUCU|nr:hypothetical protein NQ314_016475 [Rhamnusium bicolor]
MIASLNWQLRIIFSLNWQLWIIVNEKGFPTVEGLVTLYTEGITKKDYILATVQAVHLCLNKSQKKYLTTPQAIEEHGKTCTIAYEVFDCVSDEIGKYCGQTP